jgi:hypothetical protein
MGKISKFELKILFMIRIILDDVNLCPYIHRDPAVVNTIVDKKI